MLATLSACMVAWGGSLLGDLLGSFRGKRHNTLEDIFPIINQFFNPGVAHFFFVILGRWFFPLPDRRAFSAEFSPETSSGCFSRQSFVRSPSKAFFRMLCRRASDFFRLSSMVCSSLSQTERRDSISETMACCSARVEGIAIVISRNTFAGI